VVWRSCWPCLSSVAGDQGRKIKSVPGRGCLPSVTMSDGLQHISTVLPRVLARLLEDQLDPDQRGVPGDVCADRFSEPVRELGMPLRPLHRLQEDPMVGPSPERERLHETASVPCSLACEHLPSPRGLDVAFACRPSSVTHPNIGVHASHVKGLMEPIERRRELEEELRRRMRWWALDRLRLTMTEIAEATGESYKNVQNWMGTGARRKTIPASF